MWRLTISLAVLIVFGLSVPITGQIPTGSTARSMPTEVEKTDSQVSQLIARAEDHFRKGKLSLDDNKRDAAGDEFDRAVDTLLESGLDVRANQRLNTFYLELIERIYREELPPGHKQQIGFRGRNFQPLLPPQKETSNLGPCTLEVGEAPSIRGIKLGMTVSEVKGLYPNIKEPSKPDEIGISTVLYSPSIIQAPIEKLKGIDSLFLLFFKGKLYDIDVSYKEPSYWQEISELAKPLNLLNLPDKNYATAKCQGFEATIFHHSDDQKLTLSDTRVGMVIGALLIEQEENAKDCRNPPIIRGIGLGMALSQFKILFPHAQVIAKPQRCR
jgi:hypothetical protein